MWDRRLQDLLRLPARTRTLWRALRRRDSAEAEMEEEFRHHIELRAQDLQRRGLSRDDARRRAHLEFGSRETLRQRARTAMGLRWIDQLAFSWLDVKLGLRMLVKYPGLTLVAVFALAIGIPVGLAPMHLVEAIEATLPVPEGERIRVLRLWDTAASRVRRTTVYELERWGRELETFESLAAVRSTLHTVVFPGGEASPVLGAALTASSFDVLRSRPWVGRTLLPSDEQVGSPAVVLIGFELWQSRFGGDLDVVGRELRLGGVPHTVVGVMPEGFRFPVRQQLWLPLRAEPADQPGKGLDVMIFGRLARGQEVAQAQAEVGAAGRGWAVEHPHVYGRIQPEVLGFARAFFGFPKAGVRAMPEIYVIQCLTFLLLLVACTNVGLLVFARTATRSGELALRTALGAGRGRIVSQVFVESLVLSVLASAGGLLLVETLPRLLRSAIYDLVPYPPYWIDLGVTWRTALLALVLAVFCAVAAGVVPALRFTGKALHHNIRRREASRSGVRFGGFVSALIIADVAIAVAVLGLAVGLSDRATGAWRAQEALSFAAENFLAVELHCGRADPEGAAAEPDRAELVRHFGFVQQSLAERLRAEPGVLSLAVASVLPRMDHPIRWAEALGEEPAPGERRHQIRTAKIDPGFFAALNQPILAGRGFDAGDLGVDRPVVIVNTAFADRVLAGRDPIGARVRYRSWQEEPGPWLEVVGVVGPLGMHLLSPDAGAGLYHPLRPGEAHPVRLAIQVDEDPLSFTPRLRELVGEVDPNAVVAAPVVLGEVFEDDWYLALAMAFGYVLLVGILLALAASGVYAILSYTVAARTREIGIRTALGAGRAEIARMVARRALTQLAIGALLGIPLAAAFFAGIRQEWELGALAVSLAAASAILVVVALLACAAPTLRALRIAPSEALREG